jgi:hypothetical protein
MNPPDALVDPIESVLDNVLNLLCIVNDGVYGFSPLIAVSKSLALGYI